MEISAWKYPHNNLSTATQLVVRESQEAILFSKGQIVGKFGPGKHTLATENIPLIRNLFGIPFGGKNPFTAEVWFVNKTAPLVIDWQTTPMRFMDPDYNQMIPVFYRRSADGSFFRAAYCKNKQLYSIVHECKPCRNKSNCSIFRTAFSVFKRATDGLLGRLWYGTDRFLHYIGRS